MEAYYPIIAIKTRFFSTMSKPYTPILGTLAYILSEDKKSVLMVHRCGRSGDIHEGKYNGLGGKLERGEEIIAGIQRELMEEAAISAIEIQLRGTINWTGFGPHNEDWFGFIFLITKYHGTPPERNVEGKLEWIPLDQLSQLPMWEGDRFFLPLVFDGDPRPFHGFMPYEKGRPISWTFSRQ
jgi:8-oxo-dGTP diphosphatase